MSSAIKKVSRRASQLLRGEYRSQEILSDDNDGCLNLTSIIKKRSRKTPAVQRFAIAPDSPKQDEIPQLPEIRELGKRSLKKPKSTLVVPNTLSEQSADLPVERNEEIQPKASSLGLVRSSVKVSGAFPDSSRSVDHASSDHQVSPLPSPLKAMWLICDKSSSDSNESANTVIRIRPMSLKACPNHSVSPLPSPYKAWLTFDKQENQSTVAVSHQGAQASLSSNLLLEDTPAPGTNVSMWTTTTEDSSELEMPLTSQANRKGKAKARNYPYMAHEQLSSLEPSVSMTSSIQELPPNRLLRHQPRLPSQRRWVSIDEQSYTTEKELAEQAVLRHQLRLPPAASKSIVRWADLSSNFSSGNSGDLIQLRKDLRLPSHRVSTPDLGDLQRIREQVARLSEQPGRLSEDPFFDAPDVQQQISGERDHEREEFGATELGQEQPRYNFFRSNQPADLRREHRAIIDNLNFAVQRVHHEMTRLQLENGQLLRSQDEAIQRTAFLEEQLVELQDAMRERQREKEELVGFLQEKGIPLPQRRLEDRNESSLQISLQNGDDSYDADVSDNSAMVGEENPRGRPEKMLSRATARLKVK